MFSHSRTLYFDPLVKKRFDGQLDIRAPEDLFATEDQVRDRYWRPVESLDLEDSIATMLQAWQKGDRARAAEAADEVQRRTRAHFQTQGVPVFAHPILPPQFVQAAHELISNLSGHDQSAALDDLVNHFTQNLRPAVAQELGRSSQRPTMGLGEPPARAALPAGGTSLRQSVMGERLKGLVSDQIGVATRYLDELRQTGEHEINAPSSRHDNWETHEIARPPSSFARSQTLAYLTPDKKLAGVAVDEPGRETWGPTNRDAADAAKSRIARIGEGIEKFGTPEEKEAWAKISE